MINLGVPKLDKLIGGIKEASNILVIGPPGPEKLSLGLHFIGEGLDEKQPCIYTTSDIAPKEIEDRAAEIGPDIPSKIGKGFTFIDCYSWALGTPPIGRKDIQVPGPNALDDMSIAVAQAIQEYGKDPKNGPRMVVHSLSTLLLYNNPEITFRFVQITGARLKAAGCTTLYFLESGMHEERMVVTIKHLMDSVIEMKNENNKSYLTAPLYGLKKWAEFEVGKKGLQIL
ncbi:MAG: RAD55 family ATPase [Candidatus Micrarchaeota archaeon]